MGQHRNSATAQATGSAPSRESGLSGGPVPNEESVRSRGSAPSARDEALLDAVAAGLRRYGPRKLTAQDVADAAGVSRMTFYRALGSMDNAVLLALTREFTAAVARIRAALPGPAHASGATRLAEFLGAGALAFAESELVSAVFTQQPELIEPYLSGRLGRSQEIVLDAISELLDAGRADGSIPEQAPSALTLLLLVRGVALGAPLTRGTTATANPATDPAAESSALDRGFARACAELTDLVAAAFGAERVPTAARAHLTHA
ncbi:TetR/AcrR family transcriptional regulator [Leucobacter luti]|uniref:TetR family transcriptional regulator n=1 Tax=Leucobacter luti TaxID=340320 RepID=A0A4Q7U8Y0_9MICO|nr:TetR/AcrR family transcriptional regulator [Leucobacter luti]MBL3700931.1 TetR/AcrR family transcriptional regulator [Leucobacter luti]RZT68848.1 TetR family transcriptional regulator [Leucobacter luti]